MSHINGTEFEPSSIISTFFDKVMNALLSVSVNCVSNADLPAFLPSSASDELQIQLRDEHATLTILINLRL